MKMKLVALLILVTASSAVAFGAAAEVERALTAAIQNERAAIARYEAFVAKAEEEGLAGAAALFAAMAKAERVHLRRFTRMAEERGLTVPEEKQLSIEARTTRANLQTATSIERGERDDGYLEAYRSVNSIDVSLAQVFDQTRDVETEHANLCTTALRQFEQLEEPQTYHVCDRCGYTTDANIRFCPLCRTKLD